MTKNEKKIKAANSLRDLTDILIGFGVLTQQSTVEALGTVGMVSCFFFMPF